MGRRREIAEHEGLPTRWRRKGKTYFYQVPKKYAHLWGGSTEYRLGSTFEEAMEEYIRKTAVEAVADLDDNIAEKAHDFAIRGVYILFDGDDPVYVGTSQNIPDRIGTHVKDGKVFNRVVTIPVDECHRYAVEAYYINLLTPPENVRNDQAIREDRLVNSR